MGCGASSSVAPVELSAARPPSSSNDESSDALQGSVSSQRRRTLTRRRPAISTETTSRLLDKRGSGAEVPALEKPEEVTTQLNKAMVGHPLFEHLSGKLLDRCIASMTEHKFNAGDLVIKHGDAGDQCYVVHSGAFEAFAEADRKKLEEFSAGGVFGELALLYNSPRACSVRATQDASTAYALDRDAFRLLVMMHTSGLKHGLQRYLASVPMLRDLEESQLASLADVMSCYDVVDGEYIVELGDTAECLFLVLSGEGACVAGGVGEGRRHGEAGRAAQLSDGILSQRWGAGCAREGMRMRAHRKEPRRRAHSTEPRRPHRTSIQPVRTLTPSTLTARPVWVGRAYVQSYATAKPPTPPGGEATTRSCSGCARGTFLASRASIRRTSSASGLPTSSLSVLCVWAACKPPHATR